MNKIKLKLLGERIAVKQSNAEAITDSGIILSIEPPKKYEGEVVAVGTGKFMDAGIIKPMHLKVGDIVLFGEYTGQKFIIDSVEYLMMNESDVIGIINDQ